MKPNQYQQAVLNRIAHGDRTVTGPQDTRQPMTVVTFQCSRDGDGFVAHRTVLRDDPTGDPRMDYRTEMFRIPRTGVATRL